MPITDILNRNADLYPNDIALVEINPKYENQSKMTWREYSLIEASPNESYRTEISWSEFNKRANRFANLLLARGIKKGDKVAILLMNCLEWLPIYFGVLKAGAMAVPLNYRYTADEIEYCLKLADCDVLIFGPEFIGRIEEICDCIPRVHTKLYVGDDCPTFAENYNSLVTYCSSNTPAISMTDDDFGSNLLFFGDYRLSQGNSSCSQKSYACSQDRTKPSSANKR